MKLKEYQGKEIFKRYGIPVPEGIVISTLAELEEKLEKLPVANFVVKAQVPVVSRERAGGIKFADRNDIKEVVLSLLGKEIEGFKAEELLIEERLEIEKEYFLSMVIDRSQKTACLLASLEGGVEVEKLVKTYPEKIVKIPLTNMELIEKTLSKFPRGMEFLTIARALSKMMRDCDAELIEINPLAECKGRLVAIDSKIIIDDNSLFRHPEFELQRELKGREAEATKYDMSYVELEGDIGVIGNGAGLVMATLDVLSYYGGKAANFLDIGGGASIERMEKALEIVLSRNPGKLLINIFGGITRCDEIAQGIVNYKKSKEIKIPMIVRMIGTNEEEAKKILEEGGICCVASMEEAVKKVIEWPS